MKDLTCPPCTGMLKHFTNSRPRLPLSSCLQRIRFRGSTRGHSGHLSSGTSPYFGHFEGAAELELDISTVQRCRASPPPEKKQSTMGERGMVGQASNGTGWAQGWHLGAASRRKTAPTWIRCGSHEHVEKRWVPR